MVSQDFSIPVWTYPITGLEVFDHLALEVDHQAEHAVGSGVMRAHVDREHLLLRLKFELDPGDPVGKLGGEVGNRDLFVAEGCRPDAARGREVCLPCGPSLPPTRVGHFIAGEDHRFATDREVAALWPADVVLRHQDPAQVGMAFKDDPEEVIDLALLEVCGRE